MSEELLTDIGLIKPDDIVFSLSKNGFLQCEYKGKKYPRVILSRALPFSDPENYISVQDEENNEIGLLQTLEHFSDDQCALLREALRLRYFSPVISSLKSVKEKMGYLYIEAVLENGSGRLIAVKDFSRNLRLLEGGRVLITDLDGNRYTISDFSKIDQRSRRRLEPYIV